MKIKTFFILAAMGTTLAVTPAIAQDRDRDHIEEMDRLRDRDRIYGYDLMTLDEHKELFQRLQEAETEQERRRIMEEHRQAMQERVRAVLGVIGSGRGQGGTGGGGQGGRGN